ncbi:Type 2A phosphatase activator TIP41 [Wickerhamomyces ciferrii]|uniref:Type 2A phosphatase activator TIP41 n=1 Tax=Wickerhamomyces ciferrii (strain ATCC 14091 / BCRC 22168 / CBS 111 / JCM 3599 / NBRC 0793 / NRRL Y-1031 F-60-10) TaxID=1206466 RepID=K0KC05_WICCF|nr:Type 2A phosphatase activator TIP41 [Wickerhamomyces ciferrii]CCH42600.1 Type 2A phosphatase activator TIP41 [Wickerhamomyces ciferrii]
MSQDKFTVPQNKPSSKKPTDRAPTQSPTVALASNGTISSRTPGGINTVHINAAREMFASTARARQPPSSVATNPNYIPNASNIIKRQPFDFNAIEPPVETTGTQLPSTSSTFTKPEIQVPAKNHDKSQCTNPQCAHCGRVIIPSPVASFPLVETPSISINDWEIYTTKKPILNAEEIDMEESRLGIPVPEMIFGHNKIEIKNQLKNFNISFNTPDALSLVDTTGENLIQVSYSKEWFSTRETGTNDIKGIVKPFDWTYTTNYKGSFTNDSIKLIENSEFQIPLDKLKKPDPILFFDDMVLYEDELGDNGISILSCKIRVMPERLLLLTRFFLRVDNVIFRIRDTRIYIDFNENLIIREYKEQEASYQDIIRKVSPLAGDPRSFLRDQNWIASKLPVVKVVVDSAKL